MRNLKIFPLILTFIAVLAAVGAKAQVSTEKIKAAYIYRLSQNIEWENEQNITAFNIVFYEDDKTLYQELELITKGKTLKEKPITLKKITSIDQISLTKTHIVYLGEGKKAEIEKVLKKIAGHNILLISDNSSEQKFVMINFIYPENKISFEVNKKTIIDQRLIIMPKLLLLGGSEIDVRELYKEQEKELEAEKKLVLEQQKALAQQEKKIKALNVEIEEKLKAIKKQEIEIIAKQAQITEQQRKLKQVEIKVIEKERLLSSKINELKTKEDKIAEKENVIKSQNSKVSEGEKILAKQNQEIEQRQKEIKEQEELLKQKNIQISTQENWLFIAAIILFIILTLSFFLLRMIRAKQKANKELESKNKAIREKNFEISQQKESIEIQNDQINSSIKYAFTIQQAILPMKEEIDSRTENMILFRPKDVISGDFYWFTTIQSMIDNDEIIFAAAIDCTGHGVPGAFMSMIGNRLLNEIVNERKIFDTHDILTMLDTGIKKALKQDKSDNDDGMDVSFCRVEKMDDNKVKVSFTGAKRPLYYYVNKSNKLKYIKGDRKSIGGKHHSNRIVDFKMNEIILDKGDIIYMTTDGFTDQNNPDRVKFGNKKLEKIILDSAEKPLPEQKRILETELDKHQGNSKQRDDITIFALRV